MCLSGQYDDVGIQVIIVISKASYCRTGHNFPDNLNNSLGKIHSKT
jgi:hypothetical protein